MRAIVAIGGGSLASGETRAIDEAIVSLTDKLTPRVLFLPTASHDHSGYIQEVQKAYTALGCTVEALCLWNSPPDPSSIRNALLNADIVYVGGGNTLSMLNLWHTLHVDDILREAWARGVVLSGLSAGALCWFAHGVTDQVGHGTDSLAWMNGLGLIPYTLCPHYDEPFWAAFDCMAQQAPTPAIALENGSALMVLDGRMTVLHARENVSAWLFRPGQPRQRYEGGFL